MRYSLSKQELSLISQRLANLPPRHINLDNDKLRTAGSSWTKEHMDALRVTYLDDLPLSRFFPPDYIPTNTDPDFASLASEITALSKDDIRSMSWEKSKMAPASFWMFFEDLAYAVTTKFIRTTGLHYESSEGDFSSSEDEDIHEQTSKACLESLMSGILWRASLGKVAEGREFLIDKRNKSCKVRLGTGGRVKVRTNGFLTLKAWDSSAQSWAYSRVPLISFQAKSKRPGEQTLREGQPEQFNWDTFSQEVGGLLGQAMESCKKMYRGWRDQDAWVISIHGTVIRLVTARFHEGYLRQVNSPMIRTNEYLVVFRSRPFNLKTDEGRVEALRAIISLLRWIKSGSSEQATIRDALANARSRP